MPISHKQKLKISKQKVFTIPLKAQIRFRLYWYLYFELNQIIVEAFAAKGVQAPALRVLNEKA